MGQGRGQAVQQSQAPCWAGGSLPKSHGLTCISQSWVPLVDGRCVLGAEHLQEPLHGAGVDVGQLHAAVPEGQHPFLPRRELHHCGDRRCQASSGAGLAPPARAAPRRLYLRQQSRLLPVAPPSAGTRSPAPAPPAAAGPGRTSRGTAGAQRCPASARHRHTEGIRVRAQRPDPSTARRLKGVYQGQKLQGATANPGMCPNTVPEPLFSPAAGGCSCGGEAPGPYPGTRCQCSWGQHCRRSHCMSLRRLLPPHQRWGPCSHAGLCWPSCKPGRDRARSVQEAWIQPFLTHCCGGNTGQFL